MLNIITKSVSIIITRNKKILLLKRKTKPLIDQWLYIAGGIEKGETAIQAVLREVAEETGLKLLALYSTDKCENFYSVTENVVRIAPVFYGIVDETMEVNLNNEHSDFLWLEFKEAYSKVTLPLQREILSYVNKYFIQSSDCRFENLISDDHCNSNCES